MADEAKNLSLKEQLVLLEEVGRGSFSVIHKARLGDRIVAMKSHRGGSGHADAVSRARFVHEGLTLAQLSSPNLLEVIHVEDSEAGAFIITEFVEGQTLSDALDQRVFDEVQAVSFAVEIAKAMQTVHAAGLVHRDVKPQNILLPNAGGVKLIDFGFVASARSNQDATKFVGSALYCSPEQSGLLKRNVDARSDLYSLGVVLYEAVVGKPPFSSADVGELLHMHATNAPPPLQRFATGISAGFTAMIHKLLAKDPDDRYQSAASLIADLNQLDSINEELNELGADDILGHRGRNWQEEVPFTGRSTEVLPLTMAAAKAASDGPSGWFVRGTAGSGKSRLVREVLQRSPLREGVTLRAKAQEQEALPFAVVRQLLDDYLEKIEVLAQPERQQAIDDMAALAGDDLRPYLAKVTPRLVPYFGEPESAEHFSDSHEQLTLAVTEFLTRIATKTNLLTVSIDDVQWIDSDSLTVLRGISEVEESLPLFVILTGRAEEQYQHANDRVLRRLGNLIAGQTQLGAMNVDDAKLLIRSLLGGREFDETLAAQIVARTDGSPYALIEFVRAMLEEGYLHFKWERWQSDIAGLASVSLPGNVIDLILAKVKRLGEADLNCLRIASVMGSGFTLERLAKCAELELATVVDTIERAMALRLLHSRDDRFEFVHDRIREALLSTMPESEQRQVRHQIAMTLHAISEKSEPDIYALAFFFSRGRPDLRPDLAYQYNAQAGAMALESFANDLAKASLGAALDVALRHGIDVSGRLYRQLGIAYFRSGQIETGMTFLDDALKVETDPIERSLVRYWRATGYLALETSDPAWLEINLALGEIGRFSITTRPLSLLATLSLYFFGTLRRIFPNLFGYPKGRARQEMQLQINLYFLGALVAYMQFDDIGMAQITMRSAWPSFALGPSPELVEYHYGNGLAGAVVQWRRAYETNFRQADKLLRDIPDPSAQAMNELYRALSLNFFGQIKEATEGLARLHAHGSRWLSPNHYLNVVYELVWYLHFRGYVNDAWGHFEPFYQQKVTSMGQQDHGYVVYSHTAMLRAIRGDNQGAMRDLQRAQDILNGAPVVRFNWSHYLANRLAIKYEFSDVSDLDRLEELHQEKVGMNPRFAHFHVRTFYIFLGYTRMLAAWEQGSNDNLAALQRARRMLKLSAGLPVFRGHYFVVAAAFEAVQEKYDKAHEFLDQAEALGREIEAPWFSMEAALMRARILQRTGQDVYATRAATDAYDLAMSYGFLARSRRIRQEFNLGGRRGSRSLIMGVGESQSFASASNQGSISTSSSTIQQNIQAAYDERRYNALLQVSMAYVSSPDPENQKRIALDEVIKILGAERAFLFLTEADQEGVTFANGRDYKEQDLHTDVAYSQSVLDEVLQSGEPVVFSGDDKNGLSMAASVVAQDLRSIIAAPIALQDRLLGVLYLDSRLARGVFGQDDLEILAAIGAHIAVSLETSRIQQLELAQQALQKDLEVTGAVQSLLLPSAKSWQSDTLALASDYHAAAQSGGDWWWHDVTKDGVLRVLLGDVTGHGAGAAMVTAAIAGAYQAVSAPDFEGRRGTGTQHWVDQALGALNHSLLATARDNYWMTFAIFEVDVKAGELRVWSAGAPYFFICRSGLAPKARAAGGMPLGSGPLTIGRKTFDIAPGDRLVFLTDGVPELTIDRNGKQLGNGTVGKIIASVTGLPIDEACQNFISHLHSLRGSLPLDDDMTTVFVDLKGGDDD